MAQPKFSKRDSQNLMLRECSRYDDVFNTLMLPFVTSMPDPPRAL